MTEDIEWMALIQKGYGASILYVTNPTGSRIDCRTEFVSDYGILYEKYVFVKHQI